MPNEPTGESSGNITFEIRPEQNLIELKFEGEFGLQDMLVTAKALTSDSRFRPGMNELIDVRNGKYTGRFEDARAYAEFLRHHRPGRGNGRWACLVSSDLMYGVVRMFAALAHGIGIEMEPFRDESEARGWVGEVVLLG